MQTKHSKILHVYEAVGKVDTCQIKSMGILSYLHEQDAAVEVCAAVVAVAVVVAAVASAAAVLVGVSVVVAAVVVTVEDVLSMLLSVAFVALSVL